MQEAYKPTLQLSTQQVKNTYVNNSSREGTLMAKKQYRLYLYKWAEQLFYDSKISASVMHTLKAIISCGDMKQPTIQQINDARTRSAARKFAQDDIVTNRTIRRHIKLLEELNLITVERDHKSWDNRNSYTTMAPEQNLVASRGDTMSPSISYSQGSSISKYLNPYEKDFEIKQTNVEILVTLAEYEQNKSKRQPENTPMIKTAGIKPMAESMTAALKPQREIHPIFLEPLQRKLRDLNPDQLAIFDRLVSLGIYKNLAIQWTNKYSCAQLANLIEASQLYGAEKPWAYIKASIDNLRQEQEIRPYVPDICFKPWEPGAKMSKSDSTIGLARIREIKASMQK